MRPRLVIFDVDGTLVDSAAEIVAAMQAAYRAIGQMPPAAAALRAHIGLSLGVMFEHLSPHLPAQRAGWEAAYRAAYGAARAQKGEAAISPLFPGARAALEALQAEPWTLLALATGKSRRGVGSVIAAHGLQGAFASIQTADQHPSKPNPSMIAACLAETGVAAGDAVMVGDTVMDMEMAAAAGIRGIGAAWGYHPAEQLPADCVITRFDDLAPALQSLWEAA